MKLQHIKMAELAMAAPYEAEQEDALMASLLLGAAVPVQEVVSKRPRLNSEISAGGYSDHEGYRAAMVEGESTEEGSENYDERDNVLEDGDQAMEEDDHAQGIPNQMPAMVLSRDATAFYAKRRSAMEQALLPRDGSIEAAPVELVHGVLTLEQAELMNKDGRVGIYWPQERSFIIERFLKKRERRAWAKKIRYGCRKSLADRRIRVKGRFVRAELAAEIAEKVAVAAGDPASAEAPVPGASALASSRGSVSMPGSSSSVAGASTASTLSTVMSNGVPVIPAGAYIPAGAARADAIRHALERGTAYATGQAQRRGRGYSCESYASTGSMASAPGSSGNHSPKTGPRAAGPAGRPRASSVSHVPSNLNPMARSGSSAEHVHVAHKRERRASVADREEAGSNPFQYELNLPSLAASLNRKRPRSNSCSFGNPIGASSASAAAGPGPVAVQLPPLPLGMPAMPVDGLVASLALPTAAGALSTVPEHEEVQ